MWKLNVGVTKKIGRPNYGSQGAAVTLEAEESGDVLDDLEDFGNAPENSSPPRGRRSMRNLPRPWRKKSARSRRRISRERRRHPVASRSGERRGDKFAPWSCWRNALGPTWRTWRLTISGSTTSSN